MDNKRERKRTRQPKQSGVYLWPKDEAARATSGGRDLGWKVRRRRGSCPRRTRTKRNLNRKSLQSSLLNSTKSLKQRARNPSLRATFKSSLPQHQLNLSPCLKTYSPPGERTLQGVRSFVSSANESFITGPATIEGSSDTTGRTPDSYETTRFGRHDHPTGSGWGPA